MRGGGGSSVRVPDSQEGACEYLKEGPHSLCHRPFFLGGGYFQLFLVYLEK